TKVITYGTFDLFHKGHYNLLKNAKELGDYLIVGVTTDSYDQARGKLNVVDSLMTRIENVRKTVFADEIIIEERQGQKISDIKKYNIDIFTVGSDWQGKFDNLNEYCKVVYLDRTKNISSTMLRMRNRTIIRLGIIGTGRIAKRFIPEAKLVSGIEIQAIYNPHRESAIKLSKEYDYEAPETFEEFLDKVDAVYIASPHETHYEYAKKSILAKKNVLCEKPITLSKKQTEELYALANKNSVVLLEAIKTAYCPGFNNLIGVAGSGAIGEIKNIEACFTKLEDPESRELTDKKYGGSFTELGSYVMLPIFKLMGYNYDEVRFDTLKNEDNIDIFTKAYFKYPKGIATATCGLGVKSEGQLLICGTKGYIKVEAPWWKTKYFEIHYEDPDEIERFADKFHGEGLGYEVADFVSMINDVDKSFKLTRGDSIAMSAVIEKYLSENR
ncbi:MAG: Gfo/Idh/MocA family oxidoreductase, partial [Firmicutes bacterium]|nr:Gfo/Idh/MocA family oxidoreductase [Bacillota bacterium]